MKNYVALYGKIDFKFINVCFPVYTKNNMESFDW